MENEISMSSVLHVVTLASATGKYGGPFDTASRQVRISEEIGIESTLLAGFLRGDLPDSASSVGIRTQFIPARFLSKKLGFASVGSLRMSVELMKAVRNSNVIHVHTARELIPLLALVYAGMWGKPYIVQSHGMLTSRTSIAHRALDVLVRPLVKKASSIIALTQVEADQLSSWLDGAHPPIYVLGNPLPKNIVGTFRNRPNDDEALFVARLHKRKRVGDFLTAAAVADRKKYAHNFVIVGPDGGDIGLVEDACEKHGNAFYEGAVSADEVSRRVDRTGVFVLTSDREPWGNVVAIALACGVPVILPRSAALSSLIEAYGAGRVYADSQAEVASELIHDLLTNPATYSICSAGALRLAAAELSEDHQKAMLAKIYKEASQPAGKLSNQDAIQTGSQGSEDHVPAPSGPDGQS